MDGTYDCIDRIVLNAYCPMLLVAGGVRIWYRAMEGNDKDMSDATMMRYAGRFSRREQSFCKKRNIRFIHFKTGECKHLEAEKLIPKDKSFIGVFAVFVSRAPSLLWEVKKFDNGSIISAVLCMLTKELPALLSIIKSPLTEHEKEQLSQMDEYLFVMQKECEKIRVLQNIKLA